jgi:transposase
VEQDATRMCELLVGLPDVNVLGVIDHLDGPLEVHVESRVFDRVCAGCGQPGQIKDRRLVELVDLPCFGRPTRLVWGKVRLTCVNTGCSMASWTVTDPRIAYPRMRLTDRAGRWVTEQIGRYGRTVNEIAVELDCDWHTINDTLIAYGEPLVDDPDRIGGTDALGMDETLFVKRGQWRTKTWCTSLVDVRAGRLLDIIEGRSCLPRWLWPNATPCHFTMERCAS